MFKGIRKKKYKVVLYFWVLSEFNFFLQNTYKIIQLPILVSKKCLNVTVSGQTAQVHSKAITTQEH